MKTITITITDEQYKFITKSSLTEEYQGIKSAFIRNLIDKEINKIR